MAKTKLKGFTIVELLVVIVVIGILAAITIVSYSGITKRAVDATLKLDLANASKQLKLYQVINDSFPTSIDCSTGPNPAAPKICLKPSQGNTFSNYQFNNASNPQTFSLTSTSSSGVAYYVTENAAPAAEVVATSPAVYKSNINDRAIYCRNANYTTCRNSTSGTLLGIAENDLIIGQYRDGTPDYNIRRVLLPIDTSSLPDDAIISSVALRLYGYGDSSNTDFNIVATGYTGSYPMTVNDFDDFGSVSYGTLSTVGWSLAGYNTLNLNASGIAAINKTGITLLGLRSSNDISASVPTNDEYIYPWSADKGVGFEPNITITFTRP